MNEEIEIIEGETIDLESVSENDLLTVSDGDLQILRAFAETDLSHDALVESRLEKIENDVSGAVGVLFLALLLFLAKGISGRL